jgi:7-cyano-7-deazaguanine synthase
VTHADAEGGLILLSGGVDSAALAVACRPAAGLFVDYGQRPAPAERRAAKIVAKNLGLELSELTLDLRSVGAGLLLREKPPVHAPSPEWWPYRNQLLVTLAAALAFRLSLTRVIIGTVAGDRARHADGAPAFYLALDTLLRLQEGGVTVAAPALDETTEHLVLRSGISEELLAWTVSCHRSELPCGDCPGCWKRARVMSALGLLQPFPPTGSQ